MITRLKFKSHSNAICEWVFGKLKVKIYRCVCTYDLNNNDLKVIFSTSILTCIFHHLSRKLFNLCFWFTNVFIYNRCIHGGTRRTSSVVPFNMDLFIQSRFLFFWLVCFLLSNIFEISFLIPICETLFFSTSGPSEEQRKKRNFWFSAVLKSASIICLSSIDFFSFYPISANCLHTKKKHFHSRFWPWI